jgi:hypothetical protein
VLVAVGSGVGDGVLVCVGDGVLVAVGRAAFSRAWTVAVARTLSTKDIVGVGKGRNCRYPYPPNRQAATKRQSTMEMASTAKTL